MQHMKTYKKTIEAPHLIVRYDEPQSPREWDNLGYFITCERNYQTPDGRSPHAAWVQSIVEETQHEANDSEHHAELIKAAILDESNERVVYIAPVYRYEHGAVVYRRGTASGYDYSNCGFYIVTDKTQAVLGTPEEAIERVIDDELETYTKYANGEVYAFTLYDERGEFEDACGGFYDIEDIKEHLPEEWKDEDIRDYLKY